MTPPSPTRFREAALRLAGGLRRRGASGTGGTPSGAPPASLSPASNPASGAKALAAAAGELASTLPGLLVAADEVANAIAGGVHGRRRAGQGDSFWEYRPLREGESAGRIDWRRSARSGRAFVRETEWEAAQTVCLWRDASASMRWRSDPALPSKADRATLLLLALASLLLKGGEHPRLVEARAGLSPAFGGPGALERLALRLVDPAGGGAFVPHGLPPRARAVLFGDFLAPIPETAALVASLVAIPVSATLVQVLDPAERALPFRGRVRFRGVGQAGELVVPRAENLRDAYAERLAAHQAALARLCADAGFGFAVHGTDARPAGALLDLHTALAA